MLLATENTYRNLSAFNSIDELNQAVRTHRSAHALKPTELAVLDVLAQYSCKYAGVSFLTKTNLGKLIGKSRRTIIRVCQRLEALDIIGQYEMKRASDMQQTSNAIVILAPKTANDTQEAVESVTPINSALLNSNNIKNIRTNEPAPIKPAWIPEQFYNLVACHFAKTTEVEEYWRAIYACTKRLCLPPTTVEQIGIRAFYAMKGKRRKVEKPIAYFVGAVKRLAKREYVTGLFEAAWQA